MNKLHLNITCEDYEFRRVKPMGSNPVIYLPTEWIGKEVSIIPMDMTKSDRWVEKQLGEDALYHLCIPVKEILCKIVGDGDTTGRIYMPKRFIGLDMLVIEAPYLKDFE